MDAMAQIRPSHMKVICPTAKVMPVTLNAGFQMNSWFDLKTLDISGPEDEAGIKDATKLVHGIINSEIKSGIASNRIMLGGFSQGGALALYAGLTMSEPLGGIIAFSCWLPLHRTFPDAKLTPSEVPVFQCHGDCDPVVPYKMGQMSASIIKSFMKDATFTSYRGMSHSSSADELDDLRVRIQNTNKPTIFYQNRMFLPFRHLSRSTSNHNKSPDTRILYAIPLFSVLWPLCSFRFALISICTSTLRYRLYL